MTHRPGPKTELPADHAAEIRRLQAEVTRLRADLAWAVAEAQSWRNEHPVALPSDAVFNARVAAIRASLQ